MIATAGNDGVGQIDLCPIDMKQGFCPNSRSNFCGDIRVESRPLMRGICQSYFRLTPSGHKMFRWVLGIVASLSTRGACVELCEATIQGWSAEVFSGPWIMTMPVRRLEGGTNGDC